MDNIVDTLAAAVSAIVINVKTQVESEEFTLGFDKYYNSVQMYIDTYEHHLGHEITKIELRNRYIYEVALLYVLTYIMAESKVLEFDYWPFSQASSPYAWYRPKEWDQREFLDLIQPLRKQDMHSLFISEVAGLLLDKASKRYLGEFYTPIKIAEHLVDIAKIPKSETFENVSLIDPACGGGIILGVVVNQVLSEAVKCGKNVKQVAQNLSRNIHGFDIQPFAVIMTRSILIHCTLSYLNELCTCGKTLFPNIKLQDALATYDQFWNDDKTPLFNAEKPKFNYIIGNPPFMSAKKKLLPYLDQYKNILSGHPNLYQLFLWWAVKSSQLGGGIAFLIPQSMLSGHYFRDLRGKIEEFCNIEDITRITSATGVVGKANLQMMAISLRVVGPLKPKTNTINIRKTHNGANLAIATAYQAPYENVVKKFTNKPSIWIVSDNYLDYEICEIVEAQCQRLEETNSYFTLGNGTFVWNQHKNLIQMNMDDGAIPLVSAAAVNKYRIKFPYEGNHASNGRQYALITQASIGKIHTERSVLIQRTTARKSGRRLVSGMLSNNFHQLYPKYFLENHVQYIKVPTESQDYLYGILGWLNSDLSNFFFQLRNGTAFVSLYDMLFLPIHLETLGKLAPLIKPVVEQEDENSNDVLQSTNQLIFDALSITTKQLDRISMVLAK